MCQIYNSGFRSPKQYKVELMPTVVDLRAPWCPEIQSTPIPHRTMLCIYPILSYPILNAYTQNGLLFVLGIRSYDLLRFFLLCFHKMMQMAVRKFSQTFVATSYPTSCDKSFHKPFWDVIHTFTSATSIHYFTMTLTLITSISFTVMPHTLPTIHSKDSYHIQMHACHPPPLSLLPSEISIFDSWVCSCNTHHISDITNVNAAMQSSTGVNGLHSWTFICIWTSKDFQLKDSSFSLNILRTIWSMPSSTSVYLSYNQLMSQHDVKHSKAQIWHFKYNKSMNPKYILPYHSANPPLEKTLRVRRAEGTRAKIPAVFWCWGVAMTYQVW